METSTDVLSAPATSPPQAETHATDEETAARARELYAQYSENQRMADAGTKGKNHRGRKGRRATRGTQDPAHDDIARRAYELYERSGYTPGREIEFWLEAERQLRDGSDA